MPDTNPGAALIALRWVKQQPYTCAQCSRVFQGSPQRGDRQPRYCGKSCRQKAWRQRYRPIRTPEDQ